MRKELIYLIEKLKPEHLNEDYIYEFVNVKNEQEVKEDLINKSLMEYSEIYFIMGDKIKLKSKVMSFNKYLEVKDIEEMENYIMTSNEVGMNEIDKLASLSEYAGLSIYNKKEISEKEADIFELNIEHHFRYNYIYVNDKIVKVKSIADSCNEYIEYDDLSKAIDDVNKNDSAMGRYGNKNDSAMGRY